MSLAWSVFMIFIMFDTVQSIGSAAIRASGKQKMGAFITGMAYWAVGIPLCLVLCFKYTYGIKGIWWGATSAVIFNFIAYTIIVSGMNWTQIIEEAAKIRMENEQRKLRLSISKLSDDEFQRDMAKAQSPLSRVSDDDNFANLERRVSTNQVA